MMTVGVLHWIFVVFAATSTPYGQAGRKQTSVLIDRIGVNYVPLRSAPERERACGSYGADVVDIFADSRRDSITCRMAATGWTKSIRGPEKCMTTRMRSRMSGL